MAGSRTNGASPSVFHLAWPQPGQRQRQQPCIKRTILLSHLAERGKDVASLRRLGHRRSRRPRSPTNGPAVSSRETEQNVESKGRFRPGLRGLVAILELVRAAAGDRRDPLRLLAASARLKPGPAAAAVGLETALASRCQRCADGSPRSRAGTRAPALRLPRTTRWSVASCGGIAAHAGRRQTRRTR